MLMKLWHKRFLPNVRLTLLNLILSVLFFIAGGVFYWSVLFFCGSPMSEINYTDFYNGTHWIKVPRYVPQGPWDERYDALEKHHIEETEFLINEVRNLAAKLDLLRLAMQAALLEDESLPLIDAVPKRMPSALDAMVRKDRQKNELEPKPKPKSPMSVEEMLRLARGQRGQD
jgi:hypothetical protein